MRTHRFYSLSILLLLLTMPAGARKMVAEGTPTPPAAPAEPAPAEPTPTPPAATPATTLTAESLEARITALSSDAAILPHRKQILISLAGQLAIAKNTPNNAKKIEQINMAVTLALSASNIPSPINANGGDPGFLDATTDAPHTIVSAHALLTRFGVTPGSNVFFVAYTAPDKPILKRIYERTPQYNYTNDKYNAVEDSVWNPMDSPVVHAELGTPEQILASAYVQANPLQPEMVEILNNPGTLTNQDKVRVNHGAAHCLYQMGNLMGWFTEVAVSKLVAGTTIATLENLGLTELHAATREVMTGGAAVQKQIVLAGTRHPQYGLHIKYKLNLIAEGDEPPATPKAPTLTNWIRADGPAVPTHDGYSISEAYYGFGPDIQNVFDTTALNGNTSLLWYTDNAQAKTIFEEKHTANKADKLNRESGDGAKRIQNGDGSCSLFSHDEKLLGWFMPIKKLAPIAAVNIVNPENLLVPLPEGVEQKLCQLMLVTRKSGQIKSFRVDDKYTMPKLEEGTVIAAAYYGFGPDFDGRMIQKNQNEDEHWIDGHSRYIYGEDVVRAHQMYTAWTAAGSPKPPALGTPPAPPKKKGFFKRLGAVFTG